MKPNPITIFTIFITFLVVAGIVISARILHSGPDTEREAPIRQPQRAPAHEHGIDTHVHPSPVQAHTHGSEPNRIASPSTNPSDTSIAAVTIDGERVQSYHPDTMSTRYYAPPNAEVVTINFVPANPSADVVVVAPDDAAPEKEGYQVDLGSSEGESEAIIELLVTAVDGTQGPWQFIIGRSTSP